MARLSKEERRRKARLVRTVLYQHPYGLREAEMASELGWQRRTVNNYLRALKNRGLVYKEGLDWFPDD
jgi:DNA-binding transcriptional regulator LsrR (DeoR family)